MYEHKKQPLASKQTYYKRIGRSVLLAVVVLLISLLIGVIGYHYTTGMDWLDALLNASMILSGMGPVDTITQTGANGSLLFMLSLVVLCLLQTSALYLHQPFIV